MRRRQSSKNLFSNFAHVRDLVIITVICLALTWGIGLTGLFDAVDSWLVSLRLSIHTLNYHPEATGAQARSPFPDIAVLHFDEEDLAALDDDAALHLDRLEALGLDPDTWQEREQYQWAIVRSLEILADFADASPGMTPPVIGLDFHGLGSEQFVHRDAVAAAASRLGNVVDGFQATDRGDGSSPPSRDLVLPEAVDHGFLELPSPRDGWLTMDVTRVVTLVRPRPNAPGESDISFATALFRTLQREGVEIPSEREPERIVEWNGLQFPNAFVRGDSTIQLHLDFMPPRSSETTEEGLAEATSSFPVIHFRDLEELDALLREGRSLEWPKFVALYQRPLLVGLDIQDADRVLTPHSNRLYGSHSFPGVEVHAQVLYNLINATGLLPLDWSHPGVAWVVLFGLMLWGASAAGRLPLIWSIAAGLFTLGLALVADTWLWHQHLMWLPLTRWIVGVSIANRAAAQHLARTEHRRRNLVTERLQQHVTEKVANHLIHNPQAGDLGGKKQEVTVLFSDLQGFTTMTEQLPPEQMLGLMNRYLDAMSHEIAQEEGTLANYIGDAIFAIFGAPEPLEGHATHGVRAAIRMQQSLAKFNEDLAKEGLAPLAQRIGLSTGEVLCGNVGGSDRFIWTAMGDAVPIGARLEPLNKKYGTRILMAQATREQLGPEFDVKLVDSGIQVRGREGRLDIYTVEVPSP